MERSKIVNRDLWTTGPSSGLPYRLGTGKAVHDQLVTPPSAITD